MRLFLILFFYIITFSIYATTNKYRCMWRDAPTTTMVVGWNQMSGTNPVLYFGEKDFGTDYKKYLKSQKNDHSVVYKGMNNCFVRLQGLKPNTKYYFVIRDSEGSSPRMSFQTAPNGSNERLSIIAGGDSRNMLLGRRNANKLVAKLHPHCVLFGGDFTAADTANEWQEWLDDWQLSINADGQITPILPARGNHEQDNISLVNIFDIVNPNLYYALSIGDLVRIYTLNSLIPAGGDQKTWLQKDLENNPYPIWKITQYHFAIRPHTLEKAANNIQALHWAPLFFQHRVVIAIECDVHVAKTTYPIRPDKAGDNGFIRDDAKGTVYVGEGCWGAPIRRNNKNYAWTRASGSFNHFSWIWIDNEKIEIRTVKTDAAEKTAIPTGRFEIPKGIELWKPESGEIIVIKKK